MGEGRRSDLILCSGSVLLYVLGDHEGLLPYHGGHLDFHTALTLCCNVQISVLFYVVGDHKGLLLYQGGHLDFRTALTLCCNVQISVLLCVLRDHEGLLLLGDSAKLVC